MAKNLFQDSTTSIPKSDSRIVRVAFDHTEIGARKSHIKGAVHHNEYSIKHVKGSGS